MARRNITGAVDFAHLETYTAGDPALTDEVLGLFREQLGLWLRLLDPAGSMEGWRDAAHTIKGAALGVGAFDLAKACDAAELSADADLGRRIVLLERIRTAADSALSDIAAYAHERSLQSLKAPR